MVMPGSHPVTITVGAGPPGPVIPADFAGLSFERGPLNPGNAGVPGYLFHPGNDCLVTLFRNMGLRNLRIGGGSVDEFIPAGTGRDGFTGIDNLFAFAAEAGTRVIYSFRLLNPSDRSVRHLERVNARAAGYIWRRYREHISSFAMGNEPDWHAFHTYAGRRRDPAIYEEISGVPGSAYPSFLTAWRRFTGAARAQAPGAPWSGPDTGAYSEKTFTPNSDNGISWTQQFAADHPGSSEVTDLTQHLYVGGSPGETTAGQAISNMLSPEWVNGTAIGTQPAGTTYTPYPWLYASHLAPVAAAGRSYRLTESNDYLVGVPGASNAFASALWALDYLHWWAAHAAAGVNFHNKQWLYTGTVVPDPACPGFAVTPKGYAIKAFSLGSAGRVHPVTVEGADGISLTAYCASGPAGDCVTVINKTWGAGAADADVTILPPPGPGLTGLTGAQVMTLDASEPGDAAAAGATLGGAAITGFAPWDGTWAIVPAGPRTGIRLTVRATTAAVIRIGGVGGGGGGVPPVSPGE